MKNKNGPVQIDPFLLHRAVVVVAVEVVRMILGPLHIDPLVAERLLGQRDLGLHRKLPKISQFSRGSEKYLTRPL